MVWLGIGLIAFLILALLFPNLRSLGGMSDGEFTDFLGAILILTLLGAGLIYAYRDKLGDAVQTIGITALIIFVAILAYVNRDWLGKSGEQFVERFFPPPRCEEGDRRLACRDIQDAVDRRPRDAGPPRIAAPRPRPERGDVIIRRRGGYFVARAMVDGAEINMVVDTGATAVVLRARDALRIGIEPGRLVYDVPVQTANGQTMAARIRLDSISIGGITVDGVDALVLRSGLQQSLLGMSFLSRLRSYEFSGNTLYLRI